MKKLAAVLILAAAITMTGCQGSKQEEKPAEETSRNGNITRWFYDSPPQ